MKLTIIFNHFFTRWFFETKDVKESLKIAHELTLRLLEEMKDSTAMTDLDVIAKQALVVHDWDYIEDTLRNIYCNNLAVWL